MADDPKEPQTPPVAAGDKAASSAPGEPLKGEVSRTDSPSAGASAAPVAGVRSEPPAPKPENPEAAVTATTSETSSATGQPTPAADQSKPAPRPAAPARPAPAPKPAAAAAPAGEAHVPKAAPATGPPDPPPPADLAAPAYLATLQAAIPGSVAQVSYWVGDWTIVVPLASLLPVARHLHDASDASFDYCSDLTATDWPPRAAGRFDVIYCLYSTKLRHRVRVKVIAGEHDGVPSVTDIWPAANWFEREVYDMFGVNFTGHPDRRRILMPEDWQGFPERKDYPLEGPGELLMENPIDWLKLRQAKEEAEIE